MTFIRRYIALVPFVLAVIPFTAGSATLVEQTLSGAVTWTREGSPYLVKKDTRLLSGSRLVVHPGVIIEVDTAQDESIPGGTSNVDFIAQGTVQILGSDFAPVSMVSARPPFKWGALYVLPASPAEWSSFHLSGGQLVLAQGTLSMDECRVSLGKGIALGAKASLRLNDCQVDENTAGLTFLDPSAEAAMNLTRLRSNEVGLSFRTGGTLKASDSSVYGSTKYHAVNQTSDIVNIPSLWWGTPDAQEIMRKIQDGRNTPGCGYFRFSPQLSNDPMLSAVKGFDPGQDPAKLHRQGSRFTAGPVFQTVMPDLNIPNAEVDALSFGYGIQAGFVLTKGFEIRGIAETVQIAAKNPEARSSLQMEFVRFGLTGRKHFPLGKKQRAFLFGEAGGLLGLARQDMTRPEKPWDVTTPLISKRTRETNMHVSFGVGTEFMVGKKHRAELGAHYELVPLNDNRGGALIYVQGSLNLYF